MPNDLEHAGRQNAVERFVINPIREVVLGLRDAFSPEMTKARADAMMPDLQRLGSLRFTVDRVARIVGVTVPIGTLIRVGPLIAKGAGWGAITEPKTLSYISLLLALSVSIGLFTIRATISRLRREYPDEL
jgi:hypothetical protein